MTMPVDPSFASGDNSQGTFEGNINPAWNDVLNEIPQEVHSKILPHFSNWDRNVQQKIQQVHSQYEPYKQFLENQISPDDLRMSYGLYQAIMNKPLDVIKAMKESMNLDLSDLIEQQGIVESNNAETNFAQLPPEIQQQLQQQQRQLEVVGQILMQQRQQDLQRQQEEQLDNEIKQLKNQYGDFDEEMVLMLMLNGYTGKDAVEKYFNHVNTIRGANPRPNPAPKLLGSGSAIPNQAPDVRKLDAKQTKNLVAEYLRAQLGGNVNG